MVLNRIMKFGLQFMLVHETMESWKFDVVIHLNLFLVEPTNFLGWCITSLWWNLVWWNLIISFFIRDIVDIVIKFYLRGRHAPFHSYLSLKAVINKRLIVHTSNLISFLDIGYECVTNTFQFTISLFWLVQFRLVNWLLLPLFLLIILIKKPKAIFLQFRCVATTLSFLKCLFLIF